MRKAAAEQSRADGPTDDPGSPPALLPPSPRVEARLRSRDRSATISGGARLRGPRSAKRPRRNAPPSSAGCTPRPRPERIAPRESRGSARTRTSRWGRRHPAAAGLCSRCMRQKRKGLHCTTQATLQATSLEMRSKPRGATGRAMCVLHAPPEVRKRKREAMGVGTVPRVRALALCGRTQHELTHPIAPHQSRSAGNNPTKPGPHL